MRMCRVLHLSQQVIGNPVVGVESTAWGTNKISAGKIIRRIRTYLGVDDIPARLSAVLAPIHVNDHEARRRNHCEGSTGRPATGIYLLALGELLPIQGLLIRIGRHVIADETELGRQWNRSAAQIDGLRRFGNHERVGGPVSRHGFRPIWGESLLVFDRQDTSAVPSIFFKPVFKPSLLMLFLCSQALSEYGLAPDIAYPLDTIWSTNTVPLRTDRWDRR
mgnify:CR=1 FL=1